MPIKELKDKASIEAALGNLPQGDAVVLDIDNTLFRNAIDKYGDRAPKPTEKNLSALLKYLKKTGHPVILLTARKKEHRDISLKQLEQLGFEFDALLHAPSRPDSAASNTAMKGKVLAKYLSDKGYKRLHVIDDKLKQLNAITAALQETETFRDLKAFLYHYQPTTRLLQNKDNSFPDTLEGLTKPKLLGGGTESAYQVHDSAGRHFVLKYGDSEDQIKIEILMNALYKALGVPVAEVQAYDVIPASLAKAIGMPHTAQTVQLAEFLQAAAQQDDDQIIAQARRDFVIHAFMGNIDVTKTDNFIQTASGEIKLIDAGANFIFRALGERRGEAIASVEELQTLRDKAHNASGAIWFKDLTDSEIETQVQALIKKRDAIEETLWTLCRELELPSSLQRQLINGFSHRLDGLAQLYGFSSQAFAKRDKQAIAGKTAAGVMHLQRNEQDELCILLSKRVRHNWCDNFGGKSDPGDSSLAFTAQRECKEESNDLLQYSDKELADAPFHDIVTENSEGQYLYRMYFVEANEPLDISQLHDHEHTEHHWLPLSQLQAALQANEPILEEGKTTIKVSEQIIFPPLYDMLKQAPVQTLIDGLVKGSPAITRTQGLATAAAQKASAYKPLTSTDRIREDVTQTLLNKASVLDDIKHHRHRLFSTGPAPEPVHEATDAIEQVLSPSELHLKAVMGDDFKEDLPIEENVACFIEKYSPVKPQGHEKKRLINQAVEMIQYERENPDCLFFYHGVNHDIAYIYSVYTELYRLLEADSSLNALRTDNALFHSCLDIQAFIAHFESLRPDGKIDNYDPGYMECSLSVNPFLFGSHNVDGSNTIDFYVNNDTSSKIDFKALFEASLKSMGVGDSLIHRILARLQQLAAKDRCGRLYQMVLPEEKVDNYAYAAAPLGRLNPLSVDGKGDTTQLTEVIKALREGRANKEYIAELQARVMVPPNAQIRVRQYVWSDIQKSDEVTISQIKRLAKDMAHDILQHRNPLNKLNAKSALARYLPDMLMQAGISGVDAKFTDDVVIQLIESADFESLKAIVELQPLYKEKKLSLTRKHYSNRSRNKKDNISATLLELLLSIPNSGETICAIFGVNFYEGKLDQLDISQVVRALPIDKRLDFAQTNQDVIAHGHVLADVLKELPECVRLDFATTCQNKIRDLIDILDVLERLPNRARIDLATKCQNKIISVSGIVSVLEKLPTGDRLDFATTCQDKIGVSGIVDVLEKLPIDDRLIFAKQYEAKIEDGYDLASVLSWLSVSVRIDFAIKNQGKIHNGYELDKVLYSLFSLNSRSSTGGWLDFLLQIKPIKDRLELVVILDRLPDSARLGFARKYQDWIEYAYELAEVVKSLPKCDRLGFATENQDKVRDAFEVARILNSLPKCDRLGFATENQDKVQDAFEVAHFLGSLPGSARLGFAREHQDKIKNRIDLAKVLNSLPESARFDFASEHQDMIKDGSDLAIVLNSLPESARLDFATEHQDKIRDGSVLDSVLNGLPRETLFNFVMGYKDRIRDIPCLGNVLVRHLTPCRDALAHGLDYSATPEAELLRIKYAVLIAQMEYGNWFNDKRNRKYRRKAGTLFSSFRHGSDGQEKAHQFFSDIRELDSVDKAIHMLSDLLRDPKTRYHRHSFSSFLLDELRKSNISQFNIHPNHKDNHYDRQAVIDALSASENPASGLK